MPFVPQRTEEVRDAKLKVGHGQKIFSISRARQNTYHPYCPRICMWKRPISMNVAKRKEEIVALGSIEGVL
jgi:hypothetical protein